MRNFVFALGVVAAAGSASAFVPWSNPNGNGSFFSWSNGGSDNGLFGSPILVNGDSFVFFPSNFRAQSSNGVAAQTSDRLSFTLEAFQGFEFSQITITEIGDYGVLGGGTVAANMALFTTDLNNGRIATDNQTFTANSGLSNWNLTAQTTLTGPPAWTKIQVVLNNNLLAISRDGGLSFIEKKVTRGIIITVPTPGAMALLGLGGLVATRRRR